MNKHFAFSLLCTLSYANIPTLAPIQDDNDIFTQEHTLKAPFSQVSLDGNIQVEITKGPTELLSYTSSNEAAELLIEVQDGVLYIAPKSSQSSWRKLFNWRQSDDRRSTKLKLQTPKLSEIRMHSMSYALIQSPFEINNISLSGASKLQIASDINAESLSVKLRGYSRLNTANINTNSTNINQSGMTTLSSASISSQAFDSTANEQSMQHISTLSTNTLVQSLSGQSNSEIDKVNTNQIDIHMDGVSTFNIRQLRTDALIANIAGSSELYVGQGLAKRSQLRTHNNANYSFGAFSPGTISEMDTTKDA